MEKKTVLYAPIAGSKLALGFIVPEEYQVINVELFGEYQRDILLHIDLRFKQNTVCANSREGYDWQEEEVSEFNYLPGEKHALTLTFEENAVQIELKHQQDTLVVTKNNVPIHKINYLGFTEESIICPGFIPAEKGLMRLAPYVQWPENCYRTFRETLDNLPKKQGLSGVFFAQDSIANLAQFIAELHTHFDEILVFLSSHTLQKVAEVRALQARHFNLKYYINDYQFGDLENATFSNIQTYNLALAKVNFNNIIFWQANYPFHAQRVTTLIKEQRLSTRQDIFTVWFEDKPDKADKLVLLAMSQRKAICFEGDAKEKASEKNKNKHNVPTLNEIYYYKSNMEMTYPFNEKDPLANLGSHAPALCSIPAEHVLVSSTQPRLSYHHLTLASHHTGDQYTAQPTPKLLIAIITCEKNLDKQKILRETWVEQARRANISYCFVIGKPHHPSRLEQDILYVNAPDTYEYLGMKVQSLLQYVEDETDFDYIFKIDDDCLLNIPQLLRVNYEDYDYMGTAINRGMGSSTDWHYNACSNSQLGDIHILLSDDTSWYDGQGGYFLSRKAIAYVNQNKQQLWSSLLEDYGVGKILKQQGILALYVIPQFQSMRIPHIEPWEYPQFAVLSDIPDGETTLEVWESLQENEQYNALVKEFANTFKVGVATL